MNGPTEADGHDSGSAEQARIRDMPGPRTATGLAGKPMRFAFAWPYRMLLAGAYRAGLKPWHLTLLGLGTNVWVGVLLLRGDRLLPGLLLIPAGILDVLDGAVARLRGEESRFGAFLDSVLDRVSDMILFGCLYWSLAGQGQRLEAGLALATMVIALSVSHIRAEAEAVGIPLSEGLFQRLERYLAMMLGLTVPGLLLPALAILTVLGGVTVLQRSWSALVGAGRSAAPVRTADPATEP
jgi:CDP-diacylglycerol--glycerol-3-phosphate 3-phosphatidyltransferase